MDLLAGYGSDSSDSTKGAPADSKSQVTDQNQAVPRASSESSTTVAATKAPDAASGEIASSPVSQQRQGKLPSATALFDGEIDSDDSDAGLSASTVNSHSIRKPTANAASGSAAQASSAARGQKRDRGALKPTLLTPSHVLRKKSNVSTEDTE